MDTIFLHGFKVNSLIGVYEWERQRVQAVVLDLDIGSHFQRAAQSDDVSETINYAQVAERIRQSLAEQQFLLLEALAEHIAQLVIREFHADWVRVKLIKPGILPDVAQVGVTIERSA